MRKNVPRILVLDNQHFQRVVIEKMLNEVGHHCICPLSTVDELLVLMLNYIVPFDLLVANYNALSDRVDVFDLLRRRDSIRHCLIYAAEESNMHLKPSDGLSR